MRKPMLLAAASILLLSATIALALPISALKSRPEFSPASDYGYFLWHDNEGFHLRWTTREVHRVFAGNVASDRPITDVRALRPGGGFGLRHTGPRALAFSFETEKGPDGFDFRTAGRRLTFRLMVDGHAIEVQHIHLGGASIHPKNNPFAVDR